MANKYTFQDIRLDLKNLRLSDKFSWPKCCGDSVHVFYTCEGEVTEESEVIHVGIECVHCKRIATAESSFVKHEIKGHKIKVVIYDALQRFEKI